MVRSLAKKNLQLKAIFQNNKNLLRHEKQSNNPKCSSDLVECEFCGTVALNEYGIMVHQRSDMQCIHTQNAIDKIQQSASIHDIIDITTTLTAIHIPLIGLIFLITRGQRAGDMRREKRGPWSVVVLQIFSRS